jgi:pimeloyl-ACP methyl ester carboxylesterase
MTCNFKENKICCVLPCVPAGRDDPWVVPIWGQRLKRKLPEAQYLELAPAGHCPHHEAPTGEANIVPGVLCVPFAFNLRSSRWSWRQ